MKIRQARKILKAQPENGSKRTNRYWTEKWKTYNDNMHPLNWVANYIGMRGDHRIDKAISKTSKIK